ncbi:endonuclease III [Candidatus Woesearchaeota archaeon]|jgi:endonuclease III|nr:endonuclease III [Candidatus Woesearchaeota archaeon]MBT6044988.1 endonuclease III [Candidatus Woesearchaeota archaeon]
MDEKTRIKKIISLMDKEYPEKKSSLKYVNPLQMLVSTILSAQCTDARVNIVTKKLFKDFKTARDYADVDVKVLEQYVKSTGFYRNKAKNIKKTGKMLVEEFNGKVPKEMEDMLKLAGVGRKTANVVLNHAHGKVEGIAVDTHVKRISFRLGLTKSKNPIIIERDLMGILKKKDWKHFNIMGVDHGRAICKSQKPRCNKCLLNKVCPKNGVN